MSHDLVTSHDCLFTSCEVSHSHVTFKVENLKAIKYSVRDTVVSTLPLNCGLFIVVCHLVPGPLPCPEVVAISYIRQAEVLTLFSVEGHAQVEQKNHAPGFLTLKASFLTGD